MDRWELIQPGAIRWNVAKDPAPSHEDHIELSGQRCSQYIQYGADGECRLRLRQTLVFPGLRTIPNDTHASLLWACPQSMMDFLEADGRPVLPEQVENIIFDGILTITGKAGPLRITRRLLPSREGAYALEQLTVANEGAAPVCLSWREAAPSYARGGQGVYLLRRVIEGEQGPLRPGAERRVTAWFTGQRANENQVLLPAEQELRLRQDFVAALQQNLVLETPDPVLNNGFALAKLRAAESVFQTRGGLMHCPGGLRYYAAVWANDQVEYAGPFFPYLGEENAVAASKNAYELYIPFMSDTFQAIPSSIIAEGLEIWEGAGDRGDAAMYAYGASRFVLALGDPDYAEKLLPAIEWCLEYCRRKTTAAGVVASDTDELEHRFSCGSANLSTSCLTYGGLRCAAQVERALGRDAMAKTYTARADQLEQAIEAWFGAKVEGFETYRYHEGCERLRAWICLPLVFGMARRREQTVEALFSPKLWTADGLATESGDRVFWDRSTLYALRGVLAAGETERAMAHLIPYTRRRTLGEHVPYPVEAWPEGNQRHLSAESALYCRVFTEGLFGMEPVDFNAFRLTPRLPKGWERMALRGICAHGSRFDLEICRSEGGCRVLLRREGTIQAYQLAEGETVTIRLAEK